MLAEHGIDVRQFRKRRGQTWGQELSKEGGVRGSYSHGARWRYRSTFFDEHVHGPYPLINAHIQQALEYDEDPSFENERQLAFYRLNAALASGDSQVGPDVHLCAILLGCDESSPDNQGSCPPPSWKSPLPYISGRSTA